MSKLYTVTLIHINCMSVASLTVLAQPMEKKRKKHFFPIQKVCSCTNT